MTSLAVAVACGLYVQPASASCDEPYEDIGRLFGDTSPRNGATGVPLNARLMIIPTTQKPHPDSISIEVVEGGAPAEDLVATSEGTPITSAFIVNFSRPLLPGTQYVVRFAVTDGYVHPWNWELPDQWRDPVSFTTGIEIDETQPSLETVDIELAPHSFVDQGCASQRLTTVKADVSYDGADDDFGVAVVRLWSRLSNSSTQIVLEQSTQTEGILTKYVPTDGDEYDSGVLRLEVVDLAGNVRSTDPLRVRISKDDPRFFPGTGPDDEQQDDGGSGCSSTATGPLSPLWVALLALRRRR